MVSVCVDFLQNYLILHVLIEFFENLHAGWYFGWRKWLWNGIGDDMRDAKGDGIFDGSGDGIGDPYEIWIFNRI